MAVDPADAQITTIETIQMPEPVPPEPAQVIVAQQEFQGVTPEQAQGNDFQGALAQAVADQLDVDPSFVTVTSVTTNDDGAVVVMYVVQGVDPADVGDAQDNLQARDMAAAIGANLHDAGFEGAEVGPADTGMANVEVPPPPPAPPPPAVSCYIYPSKNALKRPRQTLSTHPRTHHLNICAL